MVDSSTRRGTGFFKTLCVVLLLAIASPALAEPTRPAWPRFQIGDRTAIALMGEPALRDDIAYVSFAGDLGFDSSQGVPSDLDSFMQADRALLEHFDLRVINLEFLPGTDARARSLVDRVIETGNYDVIALANNHALDGGQANLDDEIRHLESAGRMAIGTPSRPLHLWETGRQDVAISSVTHYTDVESDSSGTDAGVLIAGDEGLALVKAAANRASLHIAFVHLGSISRFPSPHEIAKVEEVIAAGADLVVCSGAHFAKGYRKIGGIPVLFGTGNHLFSYKGRNTEPLGMHVVVGIGDAGVEQIFAVPFGGDWVDGPYGPIDAAQTAEFATELAVRSDPEAGDYFSDERTADLFWNTLRRINPEKIGRLRPRHFAYAARILFARYPVVSIAAIAVALGALTAGLVYRFRRRQNDS